MGKAISVRLTDEQIARLDRAAGTAKQSRAEMAAQLVETALRIAEFPDVQFRDFGAGLEAFVIGTRLRVWWVFTLVRDYGGDVTRAAEHLNIPARTIEGALTYAAAYPDEIESAIAEHHRASDELQRILPNLTVLTVDLTAADASAS